MTRTRTDEGLKRELGRADRRLVEAGDEMERLRHERDRLADTVADLRSLASEALAELSEMRRHLDGPGRKKHGNALELALLRMTDRGLGKR